MKKENTKITNQDKIIICKDCGKEFVFPAIITVEELSKRISEEVAEQLFHKRDTLLTALAPLDDEEERRVLTEQFYKVESTIVQLSTGNTQEAYQFRGFTKEPARCLKCRTMRKTFADHTLKKTR